MHLRLRLVGDWVALGGGCFEGEDLSKRWLPLLADINFVGSGLSDNRCGSLLSILWQVDPVFSIDDIVLPSLKFLMLLYMYVSLRFDVRVIVVEVLLMRRWIVMTDGCGAAGGCIVILVRLLLFLFANWLPIQSLTDSIACTGKESQSNYCSLSHN